MNKLFSIILVGIFSSLCSASVVTDASQKIEAIINKYSNHHVFSGAVLVAKDGEIIYQAGHGLANREWDLKNATDVKYGLGSISKSITATLIMMMVENEEIALGDTLDQYLPEFPKKAASKITIHHLLSHTSGIPNYFKIKGWFSGDFRREVSDEEFVQIIADLGLDFEPGARYMYSNSGYFLLTKIVQSVTNKPFIEVLEERIFKPLKMYSSGPHLAGTILNKRAAGYRWNENGGYKNQPYINTELFRGTGDLYSTVGDLLKWEQALYTEQLLSKHSKSIMFSQENSYGWNISKIQLDKNDQKNVIWYEGQLLGFSSILTRVVDDNFTIIILSNNGMSSQERYQMTNEITLLLYDMNQSTSKQPITHLLTDALASGSLEKAITKYQADKSKNSINEARVNGLATQLLWSGATKLAIKVLEFNAEQFPNSARAYANLGEAWQQIGDLKQAQRDFAKALSFDPENSYYQQKLTQIKPK